jgi:hypothetical protein
VSLRHVSTLKSPSSVGRTGTLQQQGQQNELSDVTAAMGQNISYLLFLYQQRYCSTKQHYQQFGYV